MEVAIRRVLLGLALLILAALGAVAGMIVWSLCAATRFREQILATITDTEDIALLREFGYPYPYIREKLRRSGMDDPALLEAAMPGFERKYVLPDGVVAYEFAVTPWARGDIYFHLDDAGRVIHIDEYCPSWQIVEPGGH
jgi:hypothetical protein